MEQNVVGVYATVSLWISHKILKLSCALGLDSFNLKQ